jgi:hypothetical protein
MIKRIFLISFILLYANITFSQTDGIDFKNNTRLKLNSSLKDYLKTSLDRSFERNIVFEDSIHSLVSKSILLNNPGLQFDSSYVPKKNYLLPIGEIIVLNIGVWSMSRYISPQPWARISINSVKENWKHQWVWDADHFSTNQLMHPYHGNLYFNLARSNGLNFWESAPYSLAGSFMWEMCMELNYPSRNDLITTTMGGIALGEMTYRLSSKILDERTAGSERVWREIGAFLLSPMRGVNRLFRGEMGKVKQKSSYEIEDVYSSVSVGPSLYYEPGKMYSGNGNASLRLDLYYGNPYAEKTRKPYDFFNVKTIFNFGTQPFVNQVNVYGFLFGKNLKYKDDQKILVGLFQHFDYFNNTGYEVFGQSLGPGIMYKFPTNPKVDFQTSLHLTGIILGGGSNIPEAFKYEADGTAYRDYNFSVGFASKFETLLNLKSRAYLFIGLYNFQFYTEDGADGTDNLLIFNPRIGFAVTPTMYVGSEINAYTRTSKYDKYGTFKTAITEIRLFISNSF